MKKMIEIFTEYHNHNKITKKLYKNLRIISGQNIELEALILQIQSLERQIRKDDFHKNPDLQTLIKVKVLDSYKSLSALAKAAQVHYLQFLQTFEEYKIGLKKYDNKTKLYQRLLKGLRLTKYIYENYLLLLINIRTLFESLRLLMHLLQIKFNNSLYDEISNIIQKSLSPINKYQDGDFIKLLGNVATAVSFEASWSLYKRERIFLSEFVIIKQNKQLYDNWKPIDLFSILPSNSTFDYPIYSFFGSNKVNIISSRVLLSSANTSINERNISFDTNIISYFKSWEEKGKSLVDLSPILEFLSKPRAHYDYSPFIIENYLSKNYTKDELITEIDQIEKSLSYYEIYPYRPEYAKQVVNVISHPDFITPLEEIYKHMYLYILVITWVKLYYSNFPHEKKFEKLCDIMKSEINNYPLPEIAMAYDYYNNSDNTAGFFKKVQKNQTDLIKTIKNMAWDLFHINASIRQCIVKQDNVDLLIPYFATYDKSLSKILKYYEMEALAICYRTKEYFTFYSIRNIPLEMQKKYFNVSLKNTIIDIDEIINKYEKLIEMI